VTSTLPVESLRQLHIDEVAEVIATAFAQLEFTRWLVPGDVADRVRCLRAQFALRVRHAMRDDHCRVEGLRQDGHLKQGIVQNYLNGWTAIWEAYTPSFVESSHADQPEPEPRIRRMGLVVASRR